MTFFRTNSILGTLVLRTLALLGIYQICRLIAYVENIDSFFDLSFSGYMSIFWGGIRFDLSALGYLNALWILMLILPFNFVYNAVYQKTASYIYIIINSFGVLINLADAIYYPFSNRRSTLAIFSEFGNNDNMGQIISKGLLENWYLVLLWLVLVFVIYKVAKNTESKLIHSLDSKVWMYSKRVFRFLAVIFFTIFSIRGSFIYNTRPITVSNAGEYVSQSKEIFLVVNTPFSVLRLSHKKSLPTITYFNSYTELKTAYNPRIELQLDSTDLKGKNVVILILESFAAEYSKVFNPEREYSMTPYLDSLYQHGMLYTNSFANGRKSIDAMPSILASIPKVQTNFSLSKYSSNTYQSIAHHLKSMGYSSLFAHGAPTGSMGFNSMSKSMGFDNFYGMDEYGHDEDYDGNWGIWDHKFFPYFSSLLTQLPQPFLGAIFSVNSHHPFVLPESHTGRYKHMGQRNDLVIQYTDEAVKDFFELAKQQPWYNNTIFVITADHTSVAKDPKFSTDLGRYRVPVFIMTPDQSIPPMRNDSLHIQQTDIMPTILDMVGYEGKITAFGHSILKTSLDTHYSFTTNGAYYQLIYKDYMMLYDIEKHQVFALFNFHTDALLTENLKNRMKNTTLYQQMVTKMKGFIQQYHNRMNLDKILKDTLYKIGTFKYNILNTET